jgi:hypothetical protein
MTVPAELASSAAPDVPVTVETRGGRSNPVFLRVRRLPRGLRLDNDVAMPGSEALIVGENLDVPALSLRVGGVPTDVIEARPGSVRFMVPAALPFDEGRTLPVTVQAGSDSAPALMLFLGRLPLVTEVVPKSGQAGDRVTVRGRGFDPQPSGNALTFGNEPALVLAASESELVAIVPNVSAGAGQADVPVSVRARGSASSGARTFAIQRPSASVFTPRFFASPVAEDLSGARVFVSTALGPVMLLSGRDDAPSVAERAVRAAAAINAALSSRSALELRDAPSPAVAVVGRADVVVRATPEDVDGYAPPITPIAAGTRTSPRALAAHWTALLQDLQALCIERQRPVRMVQISPRGKVLLDLYAEAERTAGAGAGVPVRLVDPLPFAIAKGFREMALSVSPQGQTSAAAAITGTWKGTMEEEGQGERPMQLRVQLDGVRLAGAITTRAGALGMEVPVQDLAYDKGVLTFRLAGGATPRVFRATLEGATLAGTIHGASARDPVVGRFRLRYIE